jgi:long-chain acyl-CoA synthetase
LRTRKTLATLEHVVRQSSTTEEAAETVDFPPWNRSWPARVLRRLSLPTWILPLARLFAWIKVDGLEHLEHIDGPVVFAANHQSHMDAPAILWALPARWRYRVAIAMAKEFFKPHFFPAEYGRRAWATNSLNTTWRRSSSTRFRCPNARPGPPDAALHGRAHHRRLVGADLPGRQAQRFGEIGRFRPGIGMIGARLDVPVVPVRLTGLDRVLHHASPHGNARIGARRVRPADPADRR